ncbi:hypothetical protein F4779DRAFT_69878 [Xylariaceae sp. FL0662B]|nr:hypothetical protein F4779DRAFT_69878 [Xylariaceae sp. FL0662B]
MSPFNGGKHMFNNARTKIGHSHRLSAIIKKLSMMKLKNQSDGEDSNDAADNDDKSSIGKSASSPDRPDATSSSSALAIRTGASKAVGLTVAEKHQEPKGSRLLLLPQELFDAITSYLGPAHIVLLALVNKELMSRFMCSVVIRPDPSAPPDVPPSPPSPPSWKALNQYIRRVESSKSKNRGTLLSLLDYDLQDLVYCYKCKKLHDPFITFKDRAYAPNKATRCVDWPPDHHIPTRATRKLLRTITKRRLHGEPYRQLLPQVNNTTTTYQKGIMVQISLRMRYRDDQLLLRRRHIISSMDKNGFAMWSFAQLLIDPPPMGRAAATLPRVFAVCNHRSWHDEYSTLVDKWLEDFCTGSHGAERPCRPDCCDSGPRDLAKQEGHAIAERLRLVSSGGRAQATDVPALLGEVLGCDKCTTDFGLDVMALPAPWHWGFVLTTWLDLGPLDFCGKWDSHRDARPGREYARRDRHGDICARFEDLGSRLHYRPRVSEPDLERMDNFGWGQRVRDGGGRGRYMSWSSAHCCDPNTGWIEDPDPLEDTDY